VRSNFIMWAMIKAADTVLGSSLKI